MLKKAFIRSLYVVPSTVFVILFATFIWKPNYLITPPQLSGFEQQIEVSLCVLLIAFYSFVLPDRFEIELGLVNGYGTLRLAIIKVIPIFIYTVFVSFTTIAVYRYIPYDLTEFKSVLPIYVPDNFRFYTFFAVFITVIFFSSVFFLMRVLTRNCFLPIIADLLVLSGFSAISDGIKKGTTDIKVSIIDPFITTYFVGNTIPNEIAEKNQDLSMLKNAWTFNRLIFLSFSLVILAAAVFLLRREKLHRGIGE